MMTKKHFKLLAKAISEIEDVADREKMALAIGKVCQGENERFDWL